MIDSIAAIIREETPCGQVDPASDNECNTIWRPYDRTCPECQCPPGHETDVANRIHAIVGAEVERLQYDCAEAYQVIGALSALSAESDDWFASNSMQRALDNLYAAQTGEPRPHDDLLPWPDDDKLPLPAAEGANDD